MSLVDNLFGEGAWNTLIECGNVDGEQAELYERQLGEDIEVTWRWPQAHQTAIFTSDKAARWMTGLCEAPDPEMFKKFVLGLRKFTRGYGVTKVSIYAPGELADPFLAIGMQRSAENWNVVEAEITPEAGLYQWVDSQTNDA